MLVESTLCVFQLLVKVRCAFEDIVFKFDSTCKVHLYDEVLQLQGHAGMQEVLEMRNQFVALNAENNW